MAVAPGIFLQIFLVVVLCGKEVPDLFQFYHDTKPIIGTLDDIIPPITDDDIRRSVRIGVCNIYHSCVHNLIYEKDPEILKGLYKSASFVIQALWYLQSGEYIAHSQELVCKVEDSEKDIISAYIQIKNSGCISSRLSYQNVNRYQTSSSGEIIFTPAPLRISTTLSLLSVLTAMGVPSPSMDRP